jgi:hypothetical protein
MSLPAPDRRSFLLAAPALFIAGCTPAPASAASLTVFKDPGCGCCRGWVSHMASAGFSPKVVDTTDLTAIRAKHHVPDSLAACHTALIGNYVIEGHVPPDDVRRLLREKPAAAGIAVAGMQMGSPGMEVAGGQRQAYEVMLFGSGNPTVFAAHG